MTSDSRIWLSEISSAFWALPSKISSWMRVARDGASLPLGARTPSVMSPRPMSVWANPTMRWRKCGLFPKDSSTAINS